MATGGDLVIMVQKWLQLEKDARTLQSQLREIKKEQKEAAQQLATVMKEHDIDCLDVKDGCITHKLHKSKSAVSKKHLLEAISSFFDSSEDPELCSKLAGHILDTRKTKVHDKICLRGAKGK